uniref:PRC domain-containing protein n=1 Tax=Strongyloides papillosus TaxID=174720 RepID=A0A0N5BDW1_STREA
MTSQKEVTAFKTGSNKTITVDSDLLSAALARAKRFDEVIDSLPADDIFRNGSPDENSFSRRVKASSESRAFRGSFNTQVTPVNSRRPIGQSQSVSLKRKSIDNTTFVTPKRFMNSGLTSNPFKLPTRKPLPTTPSTTPKSTNISTTKFNSSDSAAHTPKSTVLSNIPTISETPLRKINESLNVDNCSFVKIKDICKEESKGKDVIGIVWEVDVSKDNVANMVIIDNSYYGVNARLAVPSALAMQFKERVKGRVIIVKDVRTIKDNEKDVLDISPDHYRFDSQSFDEEDIRDWYNSENITEDKFTIL